MLQELADFFRTRKKCNLLMVGLNLAVFFLIAVIGRSALDIDDMIACGAMETQAVAQRREYYRLFTSMFLHFGVEHLLYNMLLLLFAGEMLQTYVGIVRYLLVYLGGGLAGNILSLLHDLWTGREVVSAGASGAIFAVIGALVWLIVKNRGRVQGLNSRGILMMAVLSLAQGFMDTGVDNYAHLGGFIGGFLLAAATEILSVGAGRRK